ncbi:MAG: hypothetical protein BHV63_00230 [Alistipes sp. 56_11]|jgi:hypothetical protein|nr:MAG: hypothetical protein BHV63_00230 [Alistipes sp. 56_11]CUQ93220.1 DUF based on B. Theta Gene description [Alistipes finegoldii]
MKQLLWICAGILLTFTAVLGAFHLFYNYEYRKIRPLCGTWHSTLDDTRLAIAPCGEKFRITITRRGTSETHLLYYKDCVYYTAYGGRRIDLFYTPPADALLLVPGGAFKRISNLKDYEQ